MEKQILLRLHGITKAFPGIMALQNVNFDLYSGEVHCIVGGNGAGKSTLIKILSGVYAPTEGEIEFDGTRYKELIPSVSRQLGIQTIYQETLLAPTLSVAENIFLGDSTIKKNGLVDWKRIRHQAKEILTSMGVEIDVDETVDQLGIAGKQSVQIAKALANDAKVLIFDEPTASFGQKEVEKLFEIIQKLRQNGVGIIYISHRLEEVSQIADRISVFKDGQCVSRHKANEVDMDQLIVEMVGRSTKQFYERERVPIGETVLFADSLCGDGVCSVSFALHRGEILGIGGMVGSRRTELMKLVFGAGHITNGQIILGGQKVRPTSPMQMIHRGLCMITEDRAISGLMLERDIRENVLIARFGKYPCFFLDQAEERKTSAAQMKLLNVKAASDTQLVRNLSGGNQQKVILAKWLLTQGNIFIMDEPTRGIDIGAKEEIYKLMIELVRQGASILLVSSDTLELVSMSDRVLVMRDGRCAGMLDIDEISEENIMRVIVSGG